MEGIADAGRIENYGQFVDIGIALSKLKHEYCIYEQYSWGNA